MKIINALISCPSDVFSNFYSEIERTIDDVNFYIEKLLDTRIKIQHYSSSSFSQVGKPAQDHLDDTLIIDSDICLAFFYHRLGTATKNYRSGTDEEIHLMKNAGKHVSLFRIFDSKDDKQYEKELDDYFKDISSFSMYKTIVGKENIFKVVREDVLNFLSSSFNVDIIKIDEAFSAPNYLKSVIGYDQKKNKIIGLIEAINDLTKRKEEQDVSIKKSISEIKKDEPYKELLKNESYQKLLENAKALNNSGMNNFMREEVAPDDIFDEESKEQLAKFQKENNIDIHNDFLSFHGEKVFRNKIPLINDDLILDGSPIKDKIELIIKLSSSLKNYYSWQEYLNKYKDLVFIPLAVYNNTTLFQQYVNVKIHIKIKDYVSKISFLPDDDVALEMYSLGLDHFFNPYKRYYGFEEYDYPPFSPEVSSVVLEGTFTNYKATIDNWLNEMFDYEIERVNDEIVLSLRFNKLNAEEKHCFPTYLILRKTTESIYYEISGSGLNRKRNGKIELLSRKER